MRFEVYRIFKSKVVNICYDLGLQRVMVKRQAAFGLPSFALLSIATAVVGDKHWTVKGEV